jgi:uncharacterized peroxidase-related enzyme
MSRLTIPSLEDAPETSKPILEAIGKQLGVVPNLYRVIGKSPTALSAFTSFQGALSKTLDVKTRERIALAIAQVNGCDYCLSAHTYLGLNLAKMSPQEISLNRKGGSGDAKAQAAVNFAVKVAREHGRVSAADIDQVRDAGFTEAQIVEIVGLVVENTFTNYLNEVAQTEIDFPVVRAAAEA